MTALIRVVLDDIVYMLSLSPFNYISACLVLYVCISLIMYIVKGGDK